MRVCMTSPPLNAFWIAAVNASWQARAVDIGKIMHESCLLGRYVLNTIFVAARNGPKPLHKGPVLFSVSCRKLTPDHMCMLTCMQADRQTCLDMYIISTCGYVSMSKA